MPVHFFHCTNGTEIILDRQGRRARSKRQVEPLALQVAGELMQRGPPRIDWADWLVSVQDRKGSMVAVVPFPAGQG